MKNCLIRRKRFYEDGGLVGDMRGTTIKSNIPGIDTNYKKNINNTPKTGGMDVGGIVSGGIQLAETAYEGVENGKNNWDKGKVQTQEGQFKNVNEEANAVGQSYSAGQNKLNLLSRTGAAASAKDLKTHAGWKNVLGTTGKGAAMGASLGTMVMPGIGTAIGTAAGAIIGSAAAGIGELFGARKRKREAERLAQLKREADFAVAYHNSRQAEQLASANDQAAKIQADQNRQSVLALAAFGGRRTRKNYLLKKHSC